MKVLHIALTTVLALFFSAAVAGDCDKRLEVRYDKMTGSSTMSSKKDVSFRFHDFDKISLSMRSTEGNPDSIVIAMFVRIAFGSDVFGRRTTPCIPSDCKVTFLLESGSRLEMQTLQKMNFDGMVGIPFTFGEETNAEEFDSLSVVRVAAMRVHTCDSYVDIDWPRKKSQELLELVACFKQRIGL